MRAYDPSYNVESSLPMSVKLEVCLDGYVRCLGRPIEDVDRFLCSGLHVADELINYLQRGNPDIA